MAVTLNKANLVLKDANGNIGKIEQLSNRDLAKIKTAMSDVALVVNQSNHTPIEATTTNKGVVQLATPADVVSGASDKVVTAEHLHNATTGTSALATENLARIDAVVTEAGIPIDHTNTNQLKTAVTTLVNNAVPSTATSTTLGVVKPDNDTITIDSNGILTAIAPVTGEIKWFAFNTAPDGYLVCNGASISRTTYADLFAAIGTTFGSGDGSTTFNIPDLRDRYIIGANTNALGTQIAEQLPNIRGELKSIVSDYTGPTAPAGEGAFFNEGISKIGGANDSETWIYRSLFKASLSNSIYTDNGHVYPLSLALLPCIKY